MSDKQGGSTLTHLHWRDLEQQGPQAPQEPDASKKLPAGVCGILLGAFGVHKFILGYTTQGIVMLLLTVATFAILEAVMSWIGGAVMGVIGIIEGILYLTKSDEEFARTYVSGRRPWF